MPLAHTRSPEQIAFLESSGFFEDEFVVKYIKKYGSLDSVVPLAGQENVKIT